MYLIKKIVLAANSTAYSTDLKNYLDTVENNNETLIIKRKIGKGAVGNSLKKYNSNMENAYLLSSKANAERIFECIEQITSVRKITLLGNGMTKN